MGGERRSLEYYDGEWSRTDDAEMRAKGERERDGSEQRLWRKNGAIKKFLPGDQNVQVHCDRKCE